MQRISRILVCIVLLSVLALGSAPVWAGPADSVVSGGPGDLVWGTFLGGANNDTGYAIAVDGDGATYIVGLTYSGDLPATIGAYDTSYSDRGDLFVAKISADGTSLEYLTYLGGSEADQPRDIAVGDDGVAYVVGVTESSDFPTTAACYDASYNGSGDGFVVAVAADGASLVYATFLGGTSTDKVESIAVDSSGAAYISGSTESTDFPATAGAYATANAGGKDGFVAKLAVDGGSLVYATYLGGASSDTAMAVCVDDLGAAYVTGATYSSDFPTSVSAYDTTLGGDADAYFTKVMTDGTGLLYSTYLGGSYVDGGEAVAVDSAGIAFVGGSTLSWDFPTTAGAYATTYGGDEDGFVAKLNPYGADLLAKSTYLGGSNLDNVSAVLIDIDGRVYVAGSTVSSDFPAADGPGLDTSLDAAAAGYVLVLGNLFDEIEYASYLEGTTGSESGAYGLARDNMGDLYITGETNSADFVPIGSGYDSSQNGSGDSYIVKLTPNGDEEGGIMVLLFPFIYQGH